MTELMRDLSEHERTSQIGMPENAAGALKSVEQGAATTVWCAVSPQLECLGGVYCEDATIAKAVSADAADPRGVRPWAIDPAMAEQLWVRSETWAGVTLP